MLAEYICILLSMVILVHFQAQTYADLNNGKVIDMRHILISIK